MTNLSARTLRRGLAIAALAATAAAAVILSACGADPTPTDPIPGNSLVPNGSPVLGDPGAPVTIVEFSDFQ